jgi:uncharacterized paraquat-inducible protein A
MSRKKLAPLFEPKKLKIVEIRKQREVQVVRHGKWEKFYLWDKEIVVCDCCHEFFPAEYSETWNYCPNCGAKMDGDDNA